MMVIPANLRRQVITRADASLLKSGDRRTISKQMLYVELNAAGHARHLHYAPIWTTDRSDPTNLA